MTGLEESGETSYVGSAECRSEIEALIDHLHKEIFYISEPRSSSKGSHEKVIKLRKGCTIFMLDKQNVVN